MHRNDWSWRDGVGLVEDSGVIVRTHDVRPSLENLNVTLANKRRTSDESTALPSSGPIAREHSGQQIVGNEAVGINLHPEDLGGLRLLAVDRDGQACTEESKADAMGRELGIAGCRDDAETWENGIQDFHSLEKDALPSELRLAEDAGSAGCRVDAGKHVRLAEVGDVILGEPASGS